MSDACLKPAAAPPVRTDRCSCPSPHSTANKIARVAWAGVYWSVFRWSPPFLRGWRRFLLRCFGAKIGRGAKIMPSARIWAPWNLEMGGEACLSHDVDCYCVAPIQIGPHATVSQHAFLCTASHDIADPAMRLITAPIRIGAGAWVCARAYVGMGITVGEGSVCAACAVVVRDVPPWTIVGGNPARKIGERILRAPATP